MTHTRGHARDLLVTLIARVREIDIVVDDPFDRDKTVRLIQNLLFAIHGGEANVKGKWGCMNVYLLLHLERYAYAGVESLHIFNHDELTWCTWTAAYLEWRLSNKREFLAWCSVVGTRSYTEQLSFCYLQPCAGIPKA